MFMAQRRSVAIAQLCSISSAGIDERSKNIFSAISRASGRENSPARAESQPGDAPQARAAADDQRFYPIRIMRSGVERYQAA
jgi:hypothetical protein